MNNAKTFAISVFVMLALMALLDAYMLTSQAIILEAMK